MEKPPKLNSNKEVIAFLAEQFPLCFTTAGKIRPLKIGIFQDLVERVQGEKNISKTQLRSALRLYTSNWRYLYSITFGVQRVDLDGNLCGELETQHIEHAFKQLEKAQARVQQAKKRENGESPMLRRNTAGKRSAKGDNVTEYKCRPTFLHSKQDRPASDARQTASTAKTAPITDISTLQIGQEIKVKVGKIGKDFMEATVMEIAKEEIRVQLSSGIALIVRVEHLQF